VREPPASAQIQTTMRKRRAEISMIDYGILVIPMVMTEGNFVILL
jgi:hypothetical protein